MNRYILFSGCAAERTGRSTWSASISLTKALHLESLALSVPLCCGARLDRGDSTPESGLLMAPLLAATQQGQDIVCLSPACRCALAHHLAPRVAAQDGVLASPTPRVLDWVELLAQPANSAALVRTMKTSLSSLKVALHTHCHADHRHAKTTPEGSRSLHGAVEEARDRNMLAALVALTGAAVLDDVSQAAHCESVSLSFDEVNRHGGNSPVATCLRLAVDAGAAVLVTPCVLCFEYLNYFQRTRARWNMASAIPVLHLTQLLGFACAGSPAQLGLTRTTFSARSALLPLTG